MLAELGHFLLIVAFVLALAQIVVPAIGIQIKNDAWQKIANQAAFAQCICCIAALLILIACFVLSDFSVVTVADNSHTSKPLLYKIAAAWGNHEGSLLLWITIQSIYGAIVAKASQRAQTVIPALCRDPLEQTLNNSEQSPTNSQLKDRSRNKSGMTNQKLTTYTLIILAILNFGFLALLLFTSNPFLRLFPAPLNGLGFNPVLQDMAVSYHPPTLYFGYIGFSVPFAYAVAALLQGEASRIWASVVRKWVLFSWIMLTLGVTAGAWWAYYELGWGGWWFWDPVENASLLPWLTGTALLHSIAVFAKRGDLKIWTIFLAIITFALSLLGTFLTRSGVLTSVHAFASDPIRGYFILTMLIVVIGSALLLFALRTPLFSSTQKFTLISREGALLMNNIFLLALAFILLLGTIYPLILDSLGGPKISVGPPYYLATFVPVASLMMLLLGPAPLLQWGQANIKSIAQIFFTVALLSVAVVLCIISWQPHWTLLSLIGGALSTWLIAFGIAEITKYKTLKLPLRHWGMSLAHIGLGVAIIGMIGSVEWKQNAHALLGAGQSFEFQNKTITFQKMESETTQNYIADRAYFVVSQNGKKLFTLKPEKRFYWAEQQMTSEIAFHSIGLSNIYLALGDPQNKDNQTWNIQLYGHPLINLLWIGAVMMGLGGVLCLFSRKKP